MLRILGLVLALTGCRQLLGFETVELPTGDAGADDGSPNDVPITFDVTDAPPGCFGTGIEIVCLKDMPTMPVAFTTPQALDTDSSPMCVGVQSASTPACVIAATSITVNATLQVTGSRPLVFISLGALTVNGTIDASSTRAGAIGPAADFAGCSLGSNASGSGGGAGGSFGANGGDGGDGAGGGQHGIAGSTGIPTMLRGGCPGGIGGNGSPGEQGHGGGAVYLISAQSIQLDATINASGAGGAGGREPSRGGHGAGSGGLIGLDAPTVTIGNGARVFANGGGGGEGAGTGSTGNPGEDPVAPTQPARGGKGTNGNSGDGGDGGFSNSSARNGGNGVSSAGGGGGGGGVGYVLIFSPSVMSNGQISPMPT
jgi:hypothetical protein